MSQVIRLTTAEWSAMNAELAKGPVGKIPAIKIVREAQGHRFTDPSTGNTRVGVGLKEAKEAVEYHMTARGLMNSDGTPPWRGGEPSGRLAPMQPIKRIVVDMGDGEVEVDMEEMSLRFLTAMTTLKLTDVQRLVDLYQRVKDWEDDLCKPINRLV